MTSPAAPAADRLTLTCPTCGHAALASAALAQHRLACPNCGRPLPTAGTPEPPPAPAASAPPAAGPGTTEPITPEPQLPPRRAAGLPWIIGTGSVVALLACVGAVWYLLTHDLDPPPSGDPDYKTTTPMPVRKDFGPPLPQGPNGVGPQGPNGVGKGMRAPPLPDPDGPPRLPF